MLTHLTMDTCSVVDRYPDPSIRIVMLDSNIVG